MLENISMLLLMCICGLQWIVIQALRKKLRDALKEVHSWKLACASYENERRSW